MIKLIFLFNCFRAKNIKFEIYTTKSFAEKTLQHKTFRQNDPSI